VRKDLAYFGEFGTRGVGYNVEELYSHIMRILGLNKTWNVVIVGAGKLGSALALYRGFEARGFAVVGLMDVSEKRIGQALGKLVIESIDLLETRIKEKDVQIGILTVPGSAAQEIADRMTEAGVRSLLNFSPRVIKVPPRVIMRNVDLSVNMEVLSFYLSYFDAKKSV
jgi:redox-sensing transcriptional repressor